MAKKKRRSVIENWEIGHFFGETVIRGFVAGVRVTMLYRWWSHNHFGVSRESLGTEEILKVGRPASTAFDHLESSP